MESRRRSRLRATCCSQLAHARFAIQPRVGVDLLKPECSPCDLAAATGANENCETGFVAEADVPIARIGAER
jgi:hypothetical protein